MGKSLASDQKVHTFVLNLIETAATERQRCPTNMDIAKALNGSRRTGRVAISTVPSIMQGLVRSGHITIRVYGHNWREVLILTGSHAGSSTLPPPHGGKPYIVIDLEERRRRDQAR